MKKKILLIEDEPTIQRLLCFILSKDFDVKVAANGFEAFVWLEQHQLPDLIIMDWVMPYMDGKSFLKCIKISGLYCDIPVIVLSASKNIKEELDRLPYSINKYIPKPFDPLVLKETIGNIFNTSTYGFVN
ncbi:two-component system response regulator [Parapedobacter defluvii]|uniref:Two-component system response regulator n=1 Tax=Parapedobacter defluvii TaxID=2045106 RepID=A0ABQ1MXX1_9SPHI|nr:response regulator [Parapedobacter defluvii]GGC48779.1 two-component system response regulator [Parapedobacter defluvii]